MPAEKFGKYTLLHRLAIGGMGEIWLARQSGPAGFDRFVAIKRLLPNLAEGQEFVQMFEDEARLAARLAHPGICQVYEFDRVGKSYYLAMEYLHGETLASMLDRSVREERPLSQPLVAYIAAQALEGLHFAHEAKDAEGRSLNLIHRDISPSNIFVTYDGQVKLLDFGIAKVARRSVHTQAGSIKGKFGYIAPEVYKGDAIDRRADLFSMGVVLWEMLARRRLYNRGADYEILRAIVEEAPPDPCEMDTSVAPALAEATLRALAKFPSDRFQTALEMRRAVSAFLRGLREEMDAQRVATVMAELYGQIWIDLRSSVLESFKEGSGSVDHAEALNPTLTDSQINVLTQVAVARSPQSSPPVSPPARVAVRVSSKPGPPTSDIPNASRGGGIGRPKVSEEPRKPGKSHSSSWIGAAVAIVALASMAALAARQHRTAEPIPAEESAAAPTPTPTPTPTSMAAPTSIAAPTPTPMVNAAPTPTGALSLTATPTTRKRAARSPNHSSKPGGGGKALNPDQPMEWPSR